MSDCRSNYRRTFYYLLLEYETMKNYNKLRFALREKYGARCYRITRNAEVHIYGQMPNNSNFGWWLMGDILTAELWLGWHNEENGGNNVEIKEVTE
jgi:hypothetical protein